MVTKAELGKRSKENLKTELASYGMTVSGSKMDLVERLYQAYKTGAIPEPGSAAAAAAAVAAATVPEPAPAVEVAATPDPVVTLESAEPAAPVAAQIEADATVKNSTATIAKVDLAAAAETRVGEPTAEVRDEDAQRDALGNGVQVESTTAAAPPTTDAAPQETPAAEPAPTAAPVVGVKRSAEWANLSEEEKKKRRAERFGTLPIDHVSKKAARAERFGTVPPVGAVKLQAKTSGMDTKSVMLERAKRFGIETPELEDEKRKARAKRFGTEHAGLTKDKMAERAKRFGLAKMNDKDRMQQRALRFGLNNPAGPAGVKKSLADHPLKAK